MQWQQTCSPLPLPRVTGLLEWQIALASQALLHIAYERSVRLAVCRWQMVACRPCQLASLDGQLNLLQAACVQLNAAGQWGPLNQRWLSCCELPCRLGLVDLAQVRIPITLWRRSCLLHRSRTNHGYCLLWNSRLDITMITVQVQAQPSWLHHHATFCQLQHYRVWHVSIIN